MTDLIHYQLPPRWYASTAAMVFTNAPARRHCCIRTYRFTAAYQREFLDLRTRTDARNGCTPICTPTHVPANTHTHMRNIPISRWYAAVKTKSLIHKDLKPKNTQKPTRWIKFHFALVRILSQKQG